jgi:hypothetical protein
MPRKPDRDDGVDRGHRLTRAIRAAQWQDPSVGDNPLTAWSEWIYCREHDLEPPDWLCQYLDACAKRLYEELYRIRTTKKGTTKEQRDRAVARAFGFSRRGRGTWLDTRAGRALDTLSTFKRERERGRSYPDALQATAEVLGQSDVRHVKRKLAVAKRLTRPRRDLLKKK